MDKIAWIVVGVAAWIVAAAPVGVLVGRIARYRDGQGPRETQTDQCRARAHRNHRTSG